MVDWPALMGSSHLVIDGSNIATEGRSLPSLSQLLDAVDAAKADLAPDTVTVIVDATFGHRIAEEEQDAFEDKISSGEILIPPAGVIGRGDAFILQVADRADAVVLSNDSFQEFHGEYGWLFAEGRLLGGKHVPGVGWIFLARSPVRGVVSRKAVADAKKKKRGASTTKKQGQAKAQGAAKRSGRRGKEDAVKGSPAKKSSAKKSSAKKSARGRSATSTSGDEPERYNDALPFIEFVSTHPVGSTVEGEVEQFSSHGAYVMVGETRCYIPLKALGDPPPRSARDALSQGERYRFLVEAIDTPRRGVDLRLVTDTSAPPKSAKKSTTDKRRPAEPETKPPQPEEHLVTEAEVEDENLSVSQRRKLRAQLEAQEVAKAAGGASDVDDVEPTAEPAKSSTPRRTARKAPAKKAATKKKAPVKKAATKKKAPAKKAATKKKAPVKKAATKKEAPVKKAATKKKAPVKKAATKKKAPAKKAATKKKAPAKKATKK